MIRLPRELLDISFRGVYVRHEVRCWCEENLQPIDFDVEFLTNNRVEVWATFASDTDKAKFMLRWM